MGGVGGWGWWTRGGGASGEGGRGSVVGWVRGRVGGGLVGVAAMAMAAEVAALAARSASWLADGSVGAWAPGGWRLSAMRAAVPACSMETHAMSTAVSHGSGASSSPLASVSAQVVVAAATASSAERLLASAEEAAWVASVCRF